MAVFQRHQEESESESDAEQDLLKAGLHEGVDTNKPNKVTKKPSFNFLNVDCFTKDQMDQLKFDQNTVKDVTE